MASLFDLAKMTVSSAPGTGSTIGLGGAATVGAYTFLTFAASGVTNGTVVDYAILDANGVEIGTATYSSTGPSLTGRTPTKSSNSNAAINASSGAVISVSPRAETLNDGSLFTTGTVNPNRLGSGVVGSGAKFLADNSTFLPIVATGRLLSVQVVSSTTIVTIPTGATQCVVMGAGGCGNGSSFQAGAGGGGFLKYLTGLTAGLTFAAIIGAAGANTVLASGTQTITTLTGGAGGQAAEPYQGKQFTPGGVGTNGDLNAQGGTAIWISVPLYCSATTTQVSPGDQAFGWGRGGDSTNTAGTPGKMIFWWYS